MSAILFYKIKLQNKQTDRHSLHRNITPGEEFHPQKYKIHDDAKTLTKTK